MTGFINIVSRETQNKLEDYATILTKWSRKINLIAPSTVDDIWTRHVEDSLQLIPLLPETPSHILDIGSGAGLPGIILAITTPHRITLVDSDQKKCLFLKEALRLCKAQATVLCQRVESIEPVPYDIITSRACADLNLLLELCHPFMKEKTHCLFHKGKNYIKEIEEAEKTWKFEVDIHQSTTDALAAIIVLSNVERR